MSLPGQISDHELDEHVVEGPDVVMATQLSVEVSVGRGVPDSTSEAGRGPWRPHLTRRGAHRVVAHETEVEQADLLRVVAPHCKIGGLDVAVQKTGLVNRFHCVEALVGQSQRCRQVEDRPTALLSQLAQIFSLEKTNEVSFLCVLLVGG